MKRKKKGAVKFSEKTCESISWYSNEAGDREVELHQHESGQYFITLNGGQPKPITEVEALRDYITSQIPVERWRRILLRFLDSRTRSLLAQSIFAETGSLEPREEDLEFLTSYQVGNSDSDRSLYVDVLGRIFIKEEDEFRPIPETEALIDWIDNACPYGRWEKSLIRLLKAHPIKPHRSTLAERLAACGNG